MKVILHKVNNIIVHTVVSLSVNLLIEIRCIHVLCKNRNLH